jgi:hypothetical protein
MGHVISENTRRDWRKRKARITTTKTSNKKAKRSMAQHCKSGGRKSITVKTPRKSREGALSNVCNGRTAATAIASAASPNQNRLIVYVAEFTTSGSLVRG